MQNIKQEFEFQTTDKECIDRLTATVNDIPGEGSTASLRWKCKACNDGSHLD